MQVNFNPSYRAIIPQQQNNAEIIAANFDEENTIDNDLNMHGYRIKNVHTATDLTDAVNLQQLYDINSTYYNNLTMPTSKVYADSNLNFGSNYTVKSSKIATADDDMVNKYHIDHMSFPFSRLSGQIDASQIANNSIPGSKIQSVDYSQVSNKPTTFNSKISTTTIDSSIDLLNTYKIIRSLDPTNAQDLVTLNYLVNYIVKTSKILGDSPLNFNNFKGINLADPSGSDNKEVVNVGYLNTRLSSYNPGTASDNSIDGSKLIDNSVYNVKLRDATITNQKIADGTIITSKLADASVTNPKIVSVDWTKLTTIPRIMYEDLPYFDKSLLWIDPADSNSLEVYVLKPSYSTGTLPLVRTVNSKGNGIITFTGGNDISKPDTWPTLDYLSGKPALNFRSANTQFLLANTSILQYLSTNNVITGPTIVTAFIVFNPRSVGPYNGKLIVSDGGWGRSVGFDSRGSPNYFSVLNGTGVTGVTNLTANNWYCVNFVWRAAGTMDLNINGTQYLNRFAAGPNGRELLAIGAHHSTTNECYDGWIGDVIIYRGELNTSQTNYVKSYLNNKYGVTSFL